MKRFSFSVSFWIPFVFVALLCYLAFKLPEASRASVISFLPLAFMFVAFAFGRLYAELRRLEQKVQSLEGSRGASS